jgi:hypothetical protein
MADLPSNNSSDRGTPTYMDYGGGLHVDALEMMSLNGCEQRAPNRQASQQDKDYSTWLARRYVNMSVTDVQLNNGLRWRVASGLRIPYAGSGYLYTVRPQIPGQTRDNAAGFHKKGPSPYTVQDVFDNGPGSQPDHPGGPGMIAGTTFINPMTG